MIRPIADPLDYLAGRERLFVWLRFAALLVVLLIVAFDPGARAPAVLAASAVGLAALLNFLLWLALRRRLLVSRLSALAASGDVFLLLVLLAASGGSQSPLWMPAIVVVAATGVRFGLAGGGIAALAFGTASLIYTVWDFTSAKPVDAGSAYFESLIRVLTLILTALVAGWLARYERTLDFAERDAAHFAAGSGDSLVKGFAQLTDTISANASYRVVLEQTLDLSLQALSVPGQPDSTAAGFVLLFDQPGEEAMSVAAHRGLDYKDAAMRFETLEGHLRSVMDRGEAQRVADAQHDPLLGQMGVATNCPAMLILPLRAGYTLYGAAVFAAGQGTPDPFQNPQPLLRVYCAQAALALQNAQIYADLQAERNRIVDGEEKARHELARDLHDGPINAVAMLAMKLDFARRLLDEDLAKARQELERLQRLAAGTARELRTTMYRLRPLALEQAGLTAALDQYIRRLQAEREEPQIQLSAPPPAEFEPRLPLQSAMMVFDILKEAIGNSLKHAEARVVQVQLRVNDGWLVASASDDGKGFDVDAVQDDYAARGSLGLVNISERAALAQGDATIESSPGQGTTVTVRVPLRSPNDSPSAQ